MSAIKLVGSGKFILCENTLFDLKYDLNSGSRPKDFFRFLIILVQTLLEVPYVKCFANHV